MLENFKHPNTDIADASTRAFKTFCLTYFDDTTEKDSMENHSLVLAVRSLFEPSKNDLNIALTRGYNMAFGVLTNKLLSFLYPEIVDVLLANSVPKGNESDEAETRK